MISYDIELTEGEADYIQITLAAADEVPDLSEATITLEMTGPVSLSIPCTAGSEGVVTANIAAEYIATPGFYAGQVKVVYKDESIGMFPSSGFISMMIRESLPESSNLAKLQDELQTNVNLSQTYINSLFSAAENLLKVQTRRTTFSGLTESLAGQAILYLVIDRLATSNRDLIKSAIEEISENDARIKFNNGKNLETYRKDAELLIRELRLPNTSYPSEITFTNTSIASGYTPSDKTFYR